MKIAYVSYAEQSGVTSQVTAQLRAAGHEVSGVRPVGPLEFRDSAGRRQFTRENVRNLAEACALYGRHALNHRWNTPYAFDRHSREAGRLLSELPEKPDVVLQNGALLSPSQPPWQPYVLYCDYTSRLAAQAPAYPDAGLPAVHFGAAWYRREAATYRRAAAIATFSRNTAQSMTMHYGVPLERVHVVGVGANVFPERISRQDDGSTILFVGKQFERKGGRVLLRAFELLRRRRPEVRLVVAGPNVSIGVHSGVEHIGEVSLDRVDGLFARATVFCLPTLREPFGIAFLDALGCGVPCIGTSVDAVPEVVKEGQTGMLVAPGDPVALAEALYRMLADATRARHMGLAGRDVVGRQWLWSHVGERITHVLTRAVAATRETPGERLPTAPAVELR